MPKPGAWMETFKQISGFVLLGTVVFILSFIEAAALVPTIVAAARCRRRLLARRPHAAHGRAGATAQSVDARLRPSCWCSWPPRSRCIDSRSRRSIKAWQPFSLERLQQVAVDEGKTVLVDFSAEWCVNCKFFEKTVLHTSAVEQAIKNSKAVTMYADFTNYPPRSSGRSRPSAATACL